MTVFQAGLGGADGRRDGGREAWLGGLGGMRVSELAFGDGKVSYAR
jgi:hypothetical protein